ncbi:two-component system response regulator YesN [Paenibacillus forsythiae]|uniref:Two-component system response regulator YesN n=1 Tax=Paenibacillus forsythiae TaxID=365616 RepID=A0ABU3HCZ6_9BACL|nr:response regulator [Paenibacillus forsythiae]MDT3428697.1 two-component system response regulator YesN [Paenibacillus forsythiae]
MKALIVDDEFNVRDVIRYLGQWDQLGVTEIWEADNGEEAQIIIERERPEIIFADIKMPKVTGTQLLEWLDQRAYPGKVIIVSGYDDYSYMRKAIQCSSYDYLLKPVEEDVLNTVLEGAISAWNSEEAERRSDSAVVQETERLHRNRLITAACEGGPWNEEDLARYLPKADAYDLTLLYFYHSHSADTYINRLAEEMTAQEWGNAFVLQNDDCTGLLISPRGSKFPVEQWISNQFDIPVRLAGGDPLTSLNELPNAYQSAKKAMELQNFRTIHRLSDLDDARRMNDIVAYLEEHYTEELSLDKLANRFFLSREHICRRFKQEQGINLSNYVIQLRIEQARRWLSQTEERMYSIAVNLGYQNEKYFSKLFKKEVGMTPARYRSLYGKQNKKKGGEIGEQRYENNVDSGDGHIACGVRGKE